MERNHFISVSLDGGIIVYLVFFKSKERKERKQSTLLNVNDVTAPQTPSLNEKLNRENPVFIAGMG